MKTLPLFTKGLSLVNKWYQVPHRNQPFLETMPTRGIVALDCNPGIWDAEAPASPRGKGQRGLHTEMLSQQNKTKTKKKCPQRKNQYIYLNNSRILRKCVLSFWRFTYSNIFDIASPKDDVLIDLLSGGSRPICGAVFSTKGPHLGVEKKNG